MCVPGGIRAAFGLAAITVLPAADNTAASSLAPRSADSTVIVEINDDVITLGELRRGMKNLWCSPMFDGGSPVDRAQVIRDIEDEIGRGLIDETLIVQSFRNSARTPLSSLDLDREIARRLSTEFEDNVAAIVDYLDKTDQTAAEYRARIEEEMIVQSMRAEQRVLIPAISTADIERYYAAHQELFYRPDVVHLRLIRLASAPAETP